MAFVGLSLALSGLAVIIVAAVDPYGTLRYLDISGFNHEKTQAMNGGGRVKKALALGSGSFDGLILGTSRAESGLDPWHPGFGNLRMYNAAFANTNMDEVYQVYQFARRHMRVRQVVLGLDLLMFGERRAESGDYRLSAFASDDLGYLTNVHLWFSYDALAKSFLTVKGNWQGQKSYYTQEGFRNRNSSTSVKHRALFDDILRKNYLINEDNYARFSYDKNRLALLETLVTECRRDGIRVFLFISPVHARQLEAMRVMGLYGIFEQWKKDLVIILSALGARSERSGIVPLWDFSGYTSLTTEEIPPISSDEPMKWYWESSHYKKELGDYVLDQLLSYHSPDRSIPQDFGVELRQDNIEEHLRRVRADQDRYHATHAFEVTAVEDLARATKGFRRLY